MVGIIRQGEKVFITFRKDQYCDKNKQMKPQILCAWLPPKYSSCKPWFVGSQCKEWQVDKKDQ